MFHNRAYLAAVRPLDEALALIESKARGEEPDLPEETEPADATDLEAALEASLSGPKGRS